MWFSYVDTKNDNVLTDATIKGVAADCKISTPADQFIAKLMPWSSCSGINRKRSRSFKNPVHRKRNIAIFWAVLNMYNAPLVFNSFSANQYVGRADKVEIKVVRPLNFLDTLNSCSNCIYKIQSAKTITKPNIKNCVAKNDMPGCLSNIYVFRSTSDGL